MAWLQPLPDALVGTDPADPAAIVVSRKSVRRALVAALQTSCPRAGVWGQPGAEGAQGEAVRAPFADATLVRLPPEVDDGVLPAVLTLADVMCTAATTPHAPQA